MPSARRLWSRRRTWRSAAASMAARGVVYRGLKLVTIPIASRALASRRAAENRRRKRPDRGSSDDALTNAQTSKICSCASNAPSTVAGAAGMVVRGTPGPNRRSHRGKLHHRRWRHGLVRSLAAARSSWALTRFALVTREDTQEQSARRAAQAHHTARNGRVAPSGKAGSASGGRPARCP